MNLRLHITYKKIIIITEAKREERKQGGFYGI